MRLVPLNIALFEQDSKLLARTALFGVVVRALRSALAVSANQKPDFYKWNQLVVWDIDCKNDPKIYKLSTDSVIDLTNDKLEICIHQYWSSSKTKTPMPVLINLNGALWYADNEPADAKVPGVLTGESV